MAKIVNISKFTTLGFTEFDILEKYRSFNESEAWQASFSLSF